MIIGLGVVNKAFKAENTTTEPPKIFHHTQFHSENFYLCFFCAMLAKRFFVLKTKVSCPAAASDGFSRNKKQHKTHTKNSNNINNNDHKVSSVMFIDFSLIGPFSHKWYQKGIFLTKCTPLFSDT